jgi:hypothetical protein
MSGAHSTLTAPWKPASVSARVRQTTISNPNRHRERDVSDGIKPHEMMALRYLSTTPDRIKIIDDENTFAAAIVYCDLEKRGLVTIDKDDGMLVTISGAGLSALQRF